MKNVNALKWILVVGIVVVLNLFFNFAIKLVYDAPDYEAFCPIEQVNIAPTDQDSCVEAGGAWTEDGIIREAGGIVSTAPVPSKSQTGWCDVTYTCRQEYEDVRDVYQRNVFVILVILGIASIIVGVFVAQVSSVSLGLSLGGVLSLIIGSIRYWSSMDDYLRVIILGVALATLIWLGVKKLRD